VADRRTPSAVVETSHTDVDPQDPEYSWA